MTRNHCQAKNSQTQTCCTSSMVVTSILKSILLDQPNHGPQEIGTCLNLAQEGMTRTHKQQAPWTLRSSCLVDNLVQPVRFCTQVMKIVSSENKACICTRLALQPTRLRPRPRRTLYCNLNPFWVASWASQARGRRMEQTLYRSDPPTRSPILRRPPPPLLMDGGPKPSHDCEAK